MDNIPPFNLWEGVEKPLPGHFAFLPWEKPEGLMDNFGTIDLSATRSAGSSARSRSLLVPVALGALFSIFIFKVVKK